MTELDRIRANEILSAEVITTPGAEYASDVAAVIRLRTIRRRGQGVERPLQYDLFTRTFRQRQRIYGIKLSHRRSGSLCKGIYGTAKLVWKNHKYEPHQGFRHLANQQK